MLWNDINHALAAPFPVRDVKWRIGQIYKNDPPAPTRAMVLAYLDARDVMNRLDEVCPGQWQCRYPLISGNLIICDIGLLIEDEWNWRANGAGETAVEAEKGGCSDAFKRAAVMWGIGRYLYELPTVIIPLENGRNLGKVEHLQLSERLTAWQERKYGPVQG